jgi:FKBP-type peptidyl-prolyl cis-trans isomerase
MRTLTLALLCAALATQATAEDKKPAAATPAAPATPTPSPADTDRALNAIGLSIAKSLEPLSLTPAETDKVLAALRQGLSGKAKPPDEKGQEAVRTFIQARMTAAAEKEKARGTTYQQAAAKEKGASKTASGAIVIPIKEGTGVSPTASDKVKVNYTGTLVDGKVFDATSQHNPPAPAEFPLNGVIPCWTEALQKMKVGGHAKVVCPPEIAYGERGSPPVIPGNATLTFEIELLDVQKMPPPAATQQQPAPQAK